MDQIGFNKYYGQTILVDGKCWTFAGVDDRPPTHASGDVSAIYETCNDCILNVNAIVPPSGLSQLMGDVHYIYGDPDSIATDPYLASFNVDDNSSNNEIVWWTHTEGGVEYVIKYSQQLFAYTVGGRSINQVVVSASDGSVNDTYTITDPQSATLLNGGSWIGYNEGLLGNAISFSVQERVFPPTDCCEIFDDYFSLFNLTVSPASGFISSQVQEYGGALWYVWKQLATAYGTGSVNNPSSAGFDGLGTFLSGINGYNSRSQFEAIPSSVREGFNQTDVDAVFNKLNELAGIEGAWNADWDPLAQDPVGCPEIDTCPDIYHFRFTALTEVWIHESSSEEFVLDPADKITVINNVDSTQPNALFSGPEVVWIGQNGTGNSFTGRNYLRRNSNDIYHNFGQSIFSIPNQTQIFNQTTFTDEFNDPGTVSAIFTLVEIRRNSLGESPW
jgi:hypothetical protein